ncbi:septal ring lytic transglycosylase RlpA family protein [bacterium]|nr:septal ring lytic transglycosylase RlpA family protein [bacterium]
MRKKLLTLVLVGGLSGIFLFSGYFFNQETAVVAGENIADTKVLDENLAKIEQGTIEIVVRKGWTLEEIAQGVGMKLKELMRLNDLRDDNIYPGQVLFAMPYTAFDKVLISWYGPGFHGKRMANGEIFNMYDATICAHKWLPFGTRVRLIRMDTEESIEVVVQDRGPYVANRHFDLSYGAARLLNMVEKGVVLCKVEVIGPSR